MPEDISRQATDYRKHYAGVRMQQGRVIVDDDWNENERLDSEDRRKARVDVIGSQGTPDDGFRIANPRRAQHPLDTANQTLDFDILPGSFYLGGLRLEIEEIADPANPANKILETFLSQRDALQLSEQMPTIPSKERHDLVVLEAWQQPVTAIEDQELFEAALGGPDTSTRLRTMHRVLVMYDVPSDDCVDIWDHLKARYTGTGRGELNAEGELIPNVALTVDYEPKGDGDDLCRPSSIGGYLGAENQAIRVQITRSVDNNIGCFTWGFNNAAPMYRVQSSRVSDRIIKMVNRPRDEAQWPRAGQIVEILPWGALLPNGESVAGMTGHLSRLKTSYDPETCELTLKTALPSNFDRKWLQSSNSDYYYMRVWNRGSDLDSEPEITYSVGNEIPLGHTGLKVTFSGNGGMPGDYWIIAARPHTPYSVLPWRLEKGMPAQGVRRFYAPLAILQWKIDPGKPAAINVIRDCRKHFRPLTRQRSCCSVTVGDGKIGQGDVNSIEEALNALPLSGGEICLMPGIHTAKVSIAGKKNIVIKGCGSRTMILPASPDQVEPLFHIVDSEEIVLEQMELAGHKPVVIDGSPVAKGRLIQLPTRGIEVRNSKFLSSDCAIHVSAAADVSIHDNVIRMLNRPETRAGVFAAGRDITIEKNDIQIVPADDIPDLILPGEEDPADPCLTFGEIFADRKKLRRYAKELWKVKRIVRRPAARSSYTALGGIHIGSGSSDVKILNNVIAGGAGNGITLGHDIEIPSDAKDQVVDLCKYTYVQVIDRGKNPVKGIAVEFKNDEDQISLVSHEDGWTEFTTPHVNPPKYTVSILSPGLVIKSIDKDEYEAGKCRFYITIEPSAGTEDDGLSTKPRAPIQRVDITDNEISHMGLCGIGTPQSKISLPMVCLYNWSVKVLSRMPRLSSISIERNRISQCVHSPVSMDVAGKKQHLGFGPISLGWCTLITVKDNQLLQNGTTTKEPVYGILLLGSYMDLSGNVLKANGASVETKLLNYPTLRGGIIAVTLQTADVERPDYFGIATKEYQLRAVAGPAGPATGATASAPAKPVEQAPYALLLPLSDSMPAIKVHNNTVYQPVGCALMIKALGSVSVTHNYLHTGISDPNVFTRDMNAACPGAVFIQNSGRSVKQQAASRQAPAKGLTDGYSNSSLSALKGSGHVIFSGNETILDRAYRCAFSQVIYSSEDTGFNDNRSAVGAYDATMKGNTCLKSMVTVRAANSRFREIKDGAMKEQAAETATVISMFALPSAPDPSPYISLVTMAPVNNTTHNQADHCVIVTGTKRVQEGNQILMPAHCPKLADMVSNISNKTAVLSNLSMAMRRE